MFKKIIMPVILLFGVLLSACGTKPAPKAPAAPTITSIPDPCSPQNLPAEVKKIHDITREFDDYSTLASNVPQAQLILIIPELQRVLRNAEDQEAPVCLKALKQLQLAHMKSVVQTMLAFVGASDAPIAEQVNAGIIEALELHVQYDVERASLLGVTSDVQASPGLDSATQDVNATALALIKFTVTNYSDNAINLRSSPDTKSPEVGILGSQVTTVAYGKTANGQWIQVQIPDQLDKRAWVYVQLVSISVPIGELPVVNP